MVIITKGNTIKELEERMQTNTVNLEQWLDESKQQIATNKTKIMVFGDIKSKPRVQIKGRIIKKTDHYKYLGVVIDKKLSFCNHMTYIAEKTKNIFVAMRHYIKKSWNTGNALSTIYRGVIIPIMSYASSTWKHRSHIVTQLKKLSSAQRICLLGIIKGYKTISHEAAHIIANEPPWYINEQACFESFRNLGHSSYFNLEFNRENNTKEEIKTSIREETLRRWNEKWSQTNKGACTKEVFGDVQERGRYSFNQSRDLTCMLSGHGEFQIHLLRIGKATKGNCQTCNTLDTPSHRVLNCSNFNTERHTLITKIGVINSMNQAFKECYKKQYLSELTKFCTRNVRE